LFVSSTTSILVLFIQRSFSKYKS